MQRVSSRVNASHDELSAARFVPFDAQCRHSPGEALREEL
jgi:hypothetical protein